MRIPVLVEPVASNGYRARSGEPLPLSAEGPTAEAALANLRELLTARLTAGSQLTTVEVPGSGNPWLRGAGMFKDDPLFDEWQAAIAERRQQIDADPDIP